LLAANAINSPQGSEAQKFAQGLFGKPERPPSNKRGGGRRPRGKFGGRGGRRPFGRGGKFRGRKPRVFRKTPPKPTIEERHIRILMNANVEVVFSMAGTDTTGRVIRESKFTYVIRKKNGTLAELDKYAIEYRYRASDSNIVLEALTLNDDVEEMELEPLRECKGRFKVNWRLLKQCARFRVPITVVFRSGESFTGPIKWYGKYELSLELGRRPDVVCYFHALYDLTPQHTPPQPAVQQIPLANVILTDPRHSSLATRDMSVAPLLRHIRRIGHFPTPIILRREPDGERFSLVDGLRRLYAAREIGMVNIPAYVLD